MILQLTKVILLKEDYGIYGIMETPTCTALDEHTEFPANMISVKHDRWPPFAIKFVLKRERVLQAEKKS